MVSIIQRPELHNEDEFFNAFVIRIEPRGRGAPEASSSFLLETLVVS